MDRRQYLQAVATGGSIALAGCLGILDGSGDGQGETPSTGDATPGPTETPSVGSQEQTRTRTDAPTPSATPEPRPTPSPTPTATPTPEPADPLDVEQLGEPVSFSGGARESDEPVGTVDIVGSGPVVAEFEHDTSEKYGQYVVSVGRLGVIGGQRDCDCTGYGYVTGSGTVDVTVTAAGEWDLTIRQPRAVPDTAAPVAYLPANGYKYDVLGPYRFDGDYRISGGYTGEDPQGLSFRLTAWSPDNDRVHGTATGDWYPEWSHDGVAWLQIRSEGPWDITIERQ